MLYPDGRRVMLGDAVTLPGGLEGVVVCVLDDGQYTPEYSERDWAYLKSGALVNTIEAGLVYFPGEHDNLVLRNPKR